MSITKYYLFKERNGDDFYIAETAALQLVKPQDDEKLTLETCLDGVNQIMQAFCEVHEASS